MVNEITRYEAYLRWGHARLINQICLKIKPSLIPAKNSPISMGVGFIYPSRRRIKKYPASLIKQKLNEALNERRQAI